ncbi:uncharacterized protein F5147DRAFT_651166 [Suillus discolor]|uniref:DNA-directed RNA polymerase n=1 Tax=Suillus discolor TaxID=1912936 RepID=A0A9P7FC61_9AGAM|nr:uncharacterized protein F5147DRAFT_651166 [Suillus discolor]KAG2112068.1 hypothetical protein F5147DRAFT_651166 [Suillus discolor]
MHLATITLEMESSDTIDNVKAKIQFSVLSASYPTIHRLLLAALERRELDDRDHLRKKHLDLAGPLLAGLFRMLFKKLTKDVYRYLQKCVETHPPSMQPQPASLAVSLIQLHPLLSVPSPLLLVLSLGAGRLAPSPLLSALSLPPIPMSFPALAIAATSITLALAPRLTMRLAPTPHQIQTPVPYSHPGQGQLYLPLNHKDGGMDYDDDDVCITGSHVTADYGENITDLNSPPRRQSAHKHQLPPSTPLPSITPPPRTEFKLPEKPQTMQRDSRAAFATPDPTRRRTACTLISVDFVYFHKFIDIRQFKYKAPWGDLLYHYSSQRALATFSEFPKSYSLVPL